MDDQIGKNPHNNQESLLSSHVVLLREVHLEAAIHVMAHVGQRYNSSLVYDPSYPKIAHNVFNKCDWSELYRDAKEAIHVSAPEPQGKEVHFCMFLDNDHAEDKVSCRLINDFLA